MPDISMCSNNKCYLKDKCYRYTAKPHEYRQSYSSFDYDDSQGSCFINNQLYPKTALNNG
jgi:hypothetical protein